MPNILIRNVPPEVHARLTAAAKENGQSLQQYVLSLISEPSGRMTHGETIAWLRSRRERMLREDEEVQGDSLSGPDLVHEARLDHAREIFRTMGVDWDPAEDLP